MQYCSFDVRKLGKVFHFFEVKKKVYLQNYNKKNLPSSSSFSTVPESLLLFFFLILSNYKMKLKGRENKQFFFRIINTK